MTHARRDRNVVAFVVLTMASMLGLALPSAGTANEPPVKEIVASRVGWEVDTVTKGKVCTEHECQPAKASSEPGGFEHLKSVGGGRAPQGHVYVLDGGNYRVQELTAAGEFIAMYGWDVNKTKEEEGASQTERNICTQTSHNKCQAGSEGPAPGQFAAPESIAVDPTNDDFYVAEIVFGKVEGHLAFGQRIQKFTTDGHFILEIGKEVNETSKGNLCTQKEIDEAAVKCKGPFLETPAEFIDEDTEPGAFKFAQAPGNLLAVGGPGDLLYVGDRNGVQEFRADGTWLGEPLAKSTAISKRLFEISPAAGSKVTEIAADKTGDIFVGYFVGVPPTSIREFDQTGKEINEFSTTPSASVLGLTVDPFDRLAVIESETGQLRGLLYEVGATKLHLLTEFLNEADDIAFNGNGEMYAVKESELIGYRPVLVAELVIGSASSASCVEGAVVETSVTLNCGLSGTVNAEEIEETEAWFRSGSTPEVLHKTPKQPIPTGNTPVAVEAVVEGVRPHSPLYYELDAYDHNVKPPELLTSEQELLQTPLVPPRVVNGLNVSFVKSSSAVMSGVLNPENANTEYFFEYGPCEENQPEQCTSSVYTGKTPIRESAAYSKIKAVLEATELQPATLYHYRLTGINQAGIAVNETGGQELPEDTFTTAGTPIPEATTGPATTGTTTATITGVLNPNGQPSTYTFEVGAAKGVTTLYALVFTGSTGASAKPINETFALVGLQPGTEYAYKISIKNGFGQTEGAAQIFTTKTLPPVLVVPSPPPLLPVELAFPLVSKEPRPCRHGYVRNRHGKCVRVKKPVKRRRVHRKKGRK